MNLYGSKQKYTLTKCNTTLWNNSLWMQDFIQIEGSTSECWRSWCEIWCDLIFFALFRSMQGVVKTAEHLQNILLKQKVFITTQLSATYVWFKVDKLIEVAICISQDIFANKRSSLYTDLSPADDDDNRYWSSSVSLFNKADCAISDLR